MDCTHVTCAARRPAVPIPSVYLSHSDPVLGPTRMCGESQGIQLQVNLDTGWNPNQDGMQTPSNPHLDVFWSRRCVYRVG